MDKYTDSYNKLSKGYMKILDCIESCENTVQLDACGTMVDNWVALGDAYCEQIFYDRSIKKRKNKAHGLAQAAKVMFEDIKQTFENKNSEFWPEPYEGTFGPKPVIPLNKLYPKEIETEENDKIE